MSNIKILVCQHKEADVISNEIYTPIHVGRALSKVKLDIMGDDTGDNISEKNGSYCELTALYWAWKNMKDVDIIGLCHYRRYFEKKINGAYIDKLLNQKGYDVIVCKKDIKPCSNSDALIGAIGREGFYILCDSILKLYPNYNDSLYNYSFLSNGWIPCNMFIGKRKYVEEYSKWLFSILNDVEQHIKPSPYTRARRELGYMGEFLLGLYLAQQKKKVKFVGFRCYEGVENNITYSFVKKLRHNLAFVLLHLRALPFIGKIVKNKNVEIPSDVLVGLKRDGIDLSHLSFTA